MAIIAGDFATRLSGGANNSGGDASLGGAKSSNVIAVTLNGLFDATSASEALAGDVEYRCVYLHNSNASDTMMNAVVFISSNTALASTTIDIGVGTSAVNGTEQTVANENTAPTTVTFSAPSTAATGLSLGNIPAGQHRAYWIRRTVNTASASSPNDSATVNYQCETA